MLLSRLAESTLWLARYLERAEDLSRALLACEQLRLDMGGREAPGWQRLAPLVGVDADEAARLEPSALVGRVILDRRNPSSLLGSLSQARENLRKVRSLLPSGCWHTLNPLYLRLEALEPGVAPAELGAVLAQVVASSQRFAGQVAALMLRDESYAFLRIGVQLERADMMLRIATTIAETLIPIDQPFRFEDVRWAGLLRSVGAYQAYRRRFHTRTDFGSVLELLLFDPAFPRSFAHAIQQISSDIDGLPLNEAPRAAIRAAAPVSVPMSRGGLDQFSETALADLARLSAILAANYFAPPPDTEHSVANAARPAPAALRPPSAGERQDSTQPDVAWI